VLGPYAGLLQNSGERLELQRLYTHGTNTYYVTVDEVRYNDKAPWPPAADGGASRSSGAPERFGDDPGNWKPRPPRRALTCRPAALPASGAAADRGRRSDKA